MLKSTRISIILGLTTLLFFTNCGEYEVLEHRKLCEKRADSLYRAHKDSLYSKAEEICYEKYDELYKNVLDSLKRDKKKEIEKLLAQ